MKKLKTIYSFILSVVIGIAFFILTIDILEELLLDTSIPVFIVYLIGGIIVGKVFSYTSKTKEIKILYTGVSVGIIILILDFISLGAIVYDTNLLLINLELPSIALIAYTLGAYVVELLESHKKQHKITHRK
jgi:hypothetical protein